MERAMKMNRIMAAAVLAIMTMVSCQKDAINDGLDRFTAYQEGAATKTALDGLTPMWTPSEKISLYDGNNNIFTADISEPSATATFKGRLAGQAGRNQYLAVSPYSENYDFMTTTVYNVQVPSEQNAVKESYDPNAMVSIAYSTDKTLNFRNVCSLVKFTVVCDGVTSVKIESNDETALAGGFYITLDANGIPQANLYPKEKSPSVVLNGTFEKGATYYITVLPAVLNDGFIMTLNGSREARNVTSPVSLGRSGIINLGSVSLNPDENAGPEGPGDDGGSDEGGNGGDEGSAFPETKDAVTFYVEGDYWHLYLWDKNNKPICYPWHGKLRDDYVEIEGRSYAKFVYTKDTVDSGADVNKDILGCIGQEVQCIAIKDGYNPSGTQTGDSAKFTLKSVNVIRIENNIPVVVL